MSTGSSERPLARDNVKKSHELNNNNNNNNLDLGWKFFKKAVEHEIDDYTNCKWYS